MKLSVVSGQNKVAVVKIARRKVAFCLFYFVLKGQLRCSKDYDGPQMYYFPRVAGLLRIQARLQRPSCSFFFRPRSRQPIPSVEFKFVARQVASAVKRATKVKFVAERTTPETTLRIMLPQLATLYCETN